jgi:hypothetical protein
MKELEVLKLHGQGYSYRQIAKEVQVSLREVTKYIQTISNKGGLSSILVGRRQHAQNLVCRKIFLVLIHGIKCAVSQSNTNSSVFYLSGGEGKVERTCTVPAGKGLLIPLMVVEISDKEFPGATVEELSNAAKKDQDSVNTMYLKVDDKEYAFEDLLKYRTQPTETFQVVFPDNGIFGVTEGGSSTVVADGFYILTEPLTEGNHTVQFRSSLLCPDVGCAEPPFAQDVSYGNCRMSPEVSA